MLLLKRLTSLTPLFFLLRFTSPSTSPSTEVSNRFTVAVLGVDSDPSVPKDLSTEPGGKFPPRIIGLIPLTSGFPSNDPRGVLVDPDAWDWVIVRSEGEKMSS
jgi:hypothetical protein